MKLVGYARTSTTEQVAGLEAQIRDLTAAGCDVIFNEQVSSVGDRPEFEAAMAELQPGDALVVTKMDRLVRSLVGLLKVVENLNNSGVSLRILNMGVDTRTATGKLMLNVLASVAEFEREVMLERQKEGIAKAKSEGKFRGCQTTITARSDEAIALHAQGLRLAQIAREMGIHEQSVKKILRLNGVSYDSTPGARAINWFPGGLGGVKTLAAAE